MGNTRPANENYEPHHPEEPEAREIVRALRRGEVDAVIVEQPDHLDRIFALTPAPSTDDVEQIVNAIRRGEVDAFVVHGEKGEQVYTLSAIERSLRESEQRFRQLAESMPCIVWAADGQGKFEYYNNQWREFTNCPSGAVPDLISTMHDDDRDRFAQAWSQCIRQGGPMEIEVRLRCAANCDHKWQLVRAVPVRSDDRKVKQWFGTCTDVDAIKRAQQELDRSRVELEHLVTERTHALENSHEQLRLSERMAALGTLSAGLGHDMANLLLPIQMRLDALDRQSLSPQASADIQAIRECAEYLKRLVVGLRTFALDPMQMAPGTSTDLGKWWVQTAALLAIVLPKRAQLQGDFPENLPPVRISGSAMTQAVFNLVQNAATAIANVPSGLILVTARRADDGFVVLEVKDNGEGMSADVQQRCLEPFFTTKSQHLSTGLGLALVQGIVRHVGGALSVVSELGRGTAFQIRLPTAQRAGATRDELPQAIVTISDDRMKSFVVSLLGKSSVKYHEQSSDQDDDHDVLLWIADKNPDPQSEVERFLEADARRMVILTTADGIKHERVLQVNGFSPKGIREALNAAINRIRGQRSRTPAKA
jgi:PAS domain S-box-containing protein